MLLSIFKYLKGESHRIIPMLIVACLILVPDAGSFVVLYSIGITIALAALSHILRKLIFPYIDMRELAERASLEPMAAAVVFFSVSIMLSVFIVTGVMLLS